MPVCEICKKKVKVVYKCKECGAKFCEKCGSKEKEMCEDCLEYEEEILSGYKPEQEVEIEMESD